MKYIYGPVHSRRLGMSLGLSLTKHKTCNLDCVYCQLGPTKKLQTKRDAYVPVEEVYRELSGWVKAHSRAAKQLAYITLSGCGEPTLNTGIGELIGQIKKTISIPVCVITNASTLTDPAVREALSKCQLIVPSLDAADTATFASVNRPGDGLKLEDIVEGLVALRREFAGLIWLEVMVVKGVNDSLEQAAKLRELIDRIRPDKVQINSPVRSTAEKDVFPADKERREQIRRILGDKAEIV